MIFVSSYLCGGKTTIAKQLADKLQCDFVEVSDIVKDLLQKTKREDLQQHPELDQQIIERLKQYDDNTVVSGVRQPSILQAFPNHQYEWVETSEQTRFERYLKRADHKDGKQDGLDRSALYAKFKSANQKDKQLGLDQVRETMLEQAIRNNL